MSTTQLSLTDAELRRAGQIVIICNEMAGGASITDACQKADIEPRTWRNWRQKGWVQDIIAAKYDDVVVGARTLITDGVIDHLKILTSFAAGKIPGGDVKVLSLSPMEVIAAGRQMMDILGKMGIDLNTQEREQKELLLQLTSERVTIQQMVVITNNTGTVNEPRPEPIGVLEGQYKEVE